MNEQTGYFCTLWVVLNPKHLFCSISKIGGGEAFSIENIHIHPPRTLVFSMQLVFFTPYWKSDYRFFYSMKKIHIFGLKHFSLRWIIFFLFMPQRSPYSQYNVTVILTTSSKLYARYHLCFVFIRQSYFLCNSWHSDKALRRFMMTQTFPSNWV